MLTHAFDLLGCMRVEFKTDTRNDRARAALAALPSRFEGVFRKHMRRSATAARLGLVLDHRRRLATGGPRWSAASRTPQRVGSSQQAGLRGSSDTADPNRNPTAAC